MTETTAQATGTSVAAELLSGLTASIDQLIAAVEAGELRRLDDAGLLEFVAGFERARNRLPLVDHQVVAAVEASTLADELVAGSTTQVLTRVARVSRTEAARRVSSAEAVGTRVSMSGFVRSPRFTALAAVTRVGGVPVESAQVAVGCLRRLERRFFATTDQLRFAEVQLAEAAVVFGPEELRKVAQKIEDVLFPDGTLANEKEVADARQVTLMPKADGSYVVEGRLTGLCGAALSAVITSLAAPVPGPDGSPDERNAGQRRHDAVHTAAMMLLRRSEPHRGRQSDGHQSDGHQSDGHQSDGPQSDGHQSDGHQSDRWLPADRLLRAGGLPRSGGVPASIIVTIDTMDLLNGTGHGSTADGGRLSVSEVMRLADEAELLPALLSKGLTGGGCVLNLGRTRRCASEYQTKALIARDGGCSFPHCTSPPNWCDRHHINAWRDGGLTDLSNLTLLCGYHHAYFEQHRWVCRMLGGLPHWIPPRWVDPDQTPILHERIRNRSQRSRTGGPNG